MYMCICLLDGMYGQKTDGRRTEGDRGRRRRRRTDRQMTTKTGCRRTGYDNNKREYLEPVVMVREYFYVWFVFCCTWAKV